MIKMNLYLTHLASQLPKIRQQLDITQEDLSKLMGISRPTLVKVEKEYEKFTHAMAICLYVAITAQLEKDKRLINELRNEKASKSKKFESILLSSPKFATLSPSAMRSSFMTLHKMPKDLKDKGLSLLTAGVKGTKGLLRGKKKVEEEINQDDYLDEEFDKFAGDYLNSLEKEIIENEETCLNVFQLKTWSSLELIENIQKHNL